MMISNTRLAGRRAIVTGGGSGIGRAVAHRLATEGAAVGVIDVRQDAADAVTAAIVAEGGKAFSGLADVGSERAVEAATTELAASLGGLDTVVACAGVAFPGATHSTPLEAWEAMLRVNLTGVFLTVKHALPHLLEGGAARSPPSARSPRLSRPARAVPTTPRRAGCCSSRGRSPSNTSNRGSGPTACALAR